VGRSTHRDWDSAGLIFVEAAEKCGRIRGTNLYHSCNYEWTWCGILGKKFDVSNLYDNTIVILLLLQ